jgi:hypothetical protein
LRFLKTVRYLTGGYFSAALIGALGFLALIMGLTPQAPVPYLLPPDPSFGTRLGLDHLTSSWPAAVIYLALLLSLGSTVAIRFSPRRLIFLASHLGLWLLLVAGGLSPADREREIMNVAEGGLEWRTQKPGGPIREMPLAIRLDSFDIEEYPARLAVIDHQTGSPLAEENGRMSFWQLDPLEPAGRLMDYDLELLEFLPNAVQAGADIFVRSVTRTAFQAARISALNRRTGRRFEGWLTSGEPRSLPRPLPLEDRFLLAMTRPEPRRFISQVKVFTREGLEIESRIEVNKPLKAGSWLIYQRSYDTQAGRSSAWSGFELIQDPWLPLAQAGLILWALGSLGLIVRGARGRK